MIHTEDLRHPDDDKVWRVIMGTILAFLILAIVSAFIVSIGGCKGGGGLPTVRDPVALCRGLVEQEPDPQKRAFGEFLCAALVLPEPGTASDAGHE